MNQRLNLMAALVAIVLLVLVVAVALTPAMLARNAIRSFAPTTAPQQRAAPRGHITFAAEHDGSSDIFVVAADGTGLRNLTQNRALDGLCCLSWQP